MSRFRSHARVNVQLPMTLQANEVSSLGVVENLSLTGAQVWFEKSPRLALDQIVVAGIQVLPTLELVCVQAKVVRWGSHRIGLKWTKTGQLESALIRQLVKYHASEVTDRLSSK